MLELATHERPLGDGRSLYALTLSLERHLRTLLADASAAMDLHALQPAVAAYCRSALRAGHALDFVRHGATTAMSAAMRPETPMLRRVDVALAVTRFVEAAGHAYRVRTGGTDAARPTGRAS